MGLSICQQDDFHFVHRQIFLTNQTQPRQLVSVRLSLRACFFRSLFKFVLRPGLSSLTGLFHYKPSPYPIQQIGTYTERVAQPISSSQEKGQVIFFLHKKRGGARSEELPRPKLTKKKREAKSKKEGHILNWMWDTGRESTPDGRSWRSNQEIWREEYLFEPNPVCPSSGKNSLPKIQYEQRSSLLLHFPCSFPWNPS